MEKIVDRLTTLSIFLLILSAAVIFLVADRRPESTLYLSTTKAINDHERAYRSLAQTAESAVQPAVRRQLLQALDKSTPPWLRTIVLTSIIRPAVIQFVAIGGDLTNSLPTAVESLTTTELLTVGRVGPGSVTAKMYKFDKTRLKQELSRLGANYYPYFHQGGTVLSFAGPDKAGHAACTIGISQPAASTGFAQNYTFQLPCTPDPAKIDLTPSYYTIYGGFWQQLSIHLPPGYGYSLPFGEERDALLAEALKRSTEPQARTTILGGIDLGISELRTVAVCVILGVLLLMMNLSRSANRPPVNAEPRPVYWYGLFTNGWILLPIFILVIVPTIATAACTALLSFPVNTGLEIRSDSARNFYHPPANPGAPAVTAQPIGHLKARSAEEQDFEWREKTLRHQNQATSDPGQKQAIQNDLAELENERKASAKRDLTLQVVQSIPVLAALLIGCLVVWENSSSRARYRANKAEAEIW